MYHQNKDTLAIKKKVALLSHEHATYVAKEAKYLTMSILHNVLIKI